MSEDIQPNKSSELKTDDSKIIINEQKPRNQMFILVNTDLKMEKGKIAAQVGHVVGIITEHIIRTAYEISIKKNFPLNKLASEYSDDMNAYADTNTDSDTDTDETLTDEDIDAFCDYIHYMRWCKYDGHVKIVLKATEAEINSLIASETKYKYIRDAGKTQIAPNSLTVLGFFPSDILKEKMANFKLL
jgi:peptidyl-tRNA hydrolase